MGDKGGEEPLPRYTTRTGAESHRDLLAPMSGDRTVTPDRKQDLAPTVYYLSQEVRRFDRHRISSETVTKTQESQDKGWNQYFEGLTHDTSNASASRPIQKQLIEDSWEKVLHLLDYANARADYWTDQTWQAYAAGKHGKRELEACNDRYMLMQGL